MKTALRKDRIFEIIKTKTRFISITMLIALGVFVYTGLKATGPNIRESLDRYYSEFEMQDMSVQSTLGLDEKDINILDNAKGIEHVEYGYLGDYYIDAERNILRVYSEVLNINYYKVTLGRDIEKPDEILLDQKLKSYGYDIGETIEIEADEYSVDTINRHEYKIVGFVVSPEYLSNDDRGKTNIGSGDVFAFGIVKTDNFDSEVHSVARMKFEDTEGLKTYSKEYKEIMKTHISEVKEKFKDRPEIRFNKVVSEAELEIEKAERQLRNARNELDSGRANLEYARSQIEYGRDRLSTEKAEAIKQFAKGEAELSGGRSDLRSAKNKLDIGEFLMAVGDNREERLKQNIESSRASLSQAKNKLDESYAEIVRYESDPNLDEYQKAELKNKKAIYDMELEQYNRKSEELNSMESELISTSAQLSSGKAELSEGRAAYADGKEKLKSGMNELYSSKILAETEFSKAKDEIRDGERKYQEGLKKYEKEAPEAEKKIEEGEREVSKAKEDIRRIKVPKYMVLGRYDNLHFYQYLDNGDRIDLLSNVFPIFFFAIALLVSLTTMTRMVDEQRSFMGTLKALGYSNFDIGKKFIVYGLISGGIGIIIGSIAGALFLPKMIIDAYTVPFNLRGGVTSFYIKDILIASVISLMSTSGAAYMVARKDLRQKASELMRPKVPRSGSRILLERIKPVWRRLSFIQKVTARNLFRYKKRMLMTVFGVAGCTALIFMGFAIKHSFAGILDKQYDELMTYDAIAVYDIEENDNGELYENALEDVAGVKNSMKFNFMYGNVDDDTLRYEQTNILAVSDKKKFNNFMKLRDRKSGDMYSLKDEGVFITEKVASVLKAEVGDNMVVNIDDESYELKISGITENYAGQYIYMTDRYYEDVFKKPYEENAYMIRAKDSSEAGIDNLSRDIMNNKAALTVISSFYVKTQINNMLESMDIIVYVILLCGGLLAVVVLYNLTNINVSERQRELSTIKVLGFFDKEVTAYVYRETIILTVIGILFGYIAGIYLHRYVLLSVEPASVMIDQTTTWTSYIVSGAFTALISLFVMFVIHNKLKKINMIESLKSVE